MVFVIIVLGAADEEEGCDDGACARSPADRGRRTDVPVHGGSLHVSDPGHRRQGLLDSGESARRRNAVRSTARHTRRVARQRTSAGRRLPGTRIRLVALGRAALPAADEPGDEAVAQHPNGDEIQAGLPAAAARLWRVAADRSGLRCWTPEADSAVY